MPGRDLPRLVSGHGHVTASWRVQACLSTPDRRLRPIRSGAAITQHGLTPLSIRVSDVTILLPNLSDDNWPPPRREEVHRITLGRGPGGLVGQPPTTGEGSNPAGRSDWCVAQHNGILYLRQNLSPQTLWRLEPGGPLHAARVNRGAQRGRNREPRVWNTDGSEACRRPRPPSSAAVLGRLPGPASRFDRRDQLMEAQQRGQPSITKPVPPSGTKTEVRSKNPL